jgi:hypothetical protein
VDFEISMKAIILTPISNGWKVFMKECNKGNIDGVITPKFLSNEAGPLS